MWWQSPDVSFGAPLSLQSWSSHGALEKYGSMTIKWAATTDDWNQHCRTDSRSERRHQPVLRTWSCQQIFAWLYGVDISYARLPALSVGECQQQKKTVMEKPVMQWCLHEILRHHKIIRQARVSRLTNSFIASVVRCHYIHLYSSETLIAINGNKFRQQKKTLQKIMWH